MVSPPNSCLEPNASTGGGASLGGTPIHVFGKTAYIRAFQILIDQIQFILERKEPIIIEDSLIGYAILVTDICRPVR